MPNDTYLTALKMLARRELSEAQLRQRLIRRQHDPDAIEAALARLKAERSLDDERVAGAIARSETNLKKRGTLPRDPADRSGRHRIVHRAARRGRDLCRDRRRRPAQRRRWRADCAAGRASKTTASSNACTGTSSPRASSQTGHGAPREVSRPTRSGLPAPDLQ